VVLFGILVFYEGLVGLDISARADFVAQCFVDERKPVGHQVHPAAHRFAADLDTETLFENLLLPVERKVVAEFPEDDVAQQPRRGIGVFDQPFRGGGNNGSHGAIVDLLVFRANGNQLEKTRRHNIELLRALFADFLPEFRVFLHLVWLDHDSFDGEVFGDFRVQRLALAAL